MHVGITGHRDLSPSCERLVRRSIASELDGLDILITGYRSLAAGADQLFAEVVLERGGQLVVVIPSENYESSFTDSVAALRFKTLLNRAISTTRLPYSQPSEQAYWAAGQEIVKSSDLVLAVWDGKPAGGLGGTADVVEHARTRGKPVKVIWRAGCRRTG